jgi:NADPH-dependent 2,4-dienoyl-CoA reductase/sulfur reductase-like enzyme
MPLCAGFESLMPTLPSGLSPQKTIRRTTVPPLSKGLWKGEPIETIWRGTAELGVELHRGRSVRHVDLHAKQVTDDTGQVYAFDRLLLATGASPVRLNRTDTDVVYFRTLDDYYRLRERAQQNKRFIVIGGGFIGSELAAALALQGCRVTMLFPEEGIGGRLFPRDLALFLNNYYRERGVEVVPNEKVVALTRGGRGMVQHAPTVLASSGFPIHEQTIPQDVLAHGEEIIVHTESGAQFRADGVVAGLGVRPNTELAASAGLPVDDGIVVDEVLRAGHPDVFAAGDVASFFNPALGKRIRVEHEDNANTQGRIAGLNMAGAGLRYTHLPFFYSDLFDQGYEAVGELDARHATIEEWKEPYREGVVYYLQDGREGGVLLWNVWEKIDAARELIAEPGPHTPESLCERLLR